MIIRVTANTTLSKASIAYIEFNTPSGDIIVDCGETSSIVEDGMMKCKMKDVYFNDEYANGMLSDLNNSKLTRVCLYTTDNVDEQDLADPEVFQIIGIEAEDDKQIVNLKIKEQPEILLEED